jgi:hypothetical protein
MSPPRGTPAEGSLDGNVLGCHHKMNLSTKQNIAKHQAPLIFVASLLRVPSEGKKRIFEKNNGTKKMNTRQLAASE